jgi:hypothetical protein
MPSSENRQHRKPSAEHGAQPRSAQPSNTLTHNLPSNPISQPRKTTMNRFAHVAVIAAVALPLLTGCATSPAGALPASGSAARVHELAAVSVHAAAADAGCSNAHTRIPASAHKTIVNDIDGDGRADTAFFTATKPYEFGFATAAGGVYTTRDRDTVTGQHHAFAVNTDGFPGHVIVIDDGLAATVLTFQNCHFQHLTTATGASLTIPIGAHGAEGEATTGVACNNQNGGILLEAVQARQRSNGRYDIAWSTLEPTGTTTGVTFSRFAVRYKNLAPTDRRVKQARTSTCWAAHTLTAKH